jgi:hypothetical protein
MIRNIARKVRAKKWPLVLVLGTLCGLFVLVWLSRVRLFIAMSRLGYEFADSNGNCTAARIFQLPESAVDTITKEYLRVNARTGCNQLLATLGDIRGKKACEFLIEIATDPSTAFLHRQIAIYQLGKFPESEYPEILPVLLGLLDSSSEDFSLCVSAAEALLGVEIAFDAPSRKRGSFRGCAMRRYLRDRACFDRTMAIAAVRNARDRSSERKREVLTNLLRNLGLEETK